MAIDPGTPPAGTDLCERRFLTLNRDRLRRVHDNLSPRQREFLDLLPLLFHVNHPLLPGYVDQAVPIGINDYTPSPAALHAARRLVRAFDYERRSATRYAIRGLYMMGSPGTIAYARDSDLDMWLLHDPELTEEAVHALAEKAARIERYAGGLGLETHFFVFDAERFRRGETLSLSAESSGSSQHCLLLDEFYRSSLLIAGLRPLWWRVPAAHEHDYENYVAAAHARHEFDRRDYLDFGTLHDIPVEEFFGATVWHLYKSIESPYKSVLKLLLMEAYAAEYPRIELLSRRFKLNVESRAADLDALDPYILMYAKTAEYLNLRGDRLRLEVLRRSFYIKTDLRLSARTTAAADDWRSAALAALVAAWGWTPYDVDRLDRRQGWRLDTALEERRDLIKTIKDSYAALSRFARDHAADQKITEHDLNVLGRKLYAAFEKKPAKVEVVTRGICSNPVEPVLSLHEVRHGEAASVWLLYSGLVKPAETGFRKPMKRAASALEMLVWGQLNRLFDQATAWHVFAPASALAVAELRRICETLEPALGALTLPATLAARPRITQAFLFANVGVDPFATSLVQGTVLTTNRTDPFQFGGRRSNLLRSIDLVFVTTWAETFAFHYEGPTALLDALAECVQWAPFDGSETELPVCTVRCFTSDYALQIAERVGRCFTSASRYFARHAAQAPHFVLELDERLHHLRLADGKPRVASWPSHAHLIKALGEADGLRFATARFDHGCARAGLLPRLYAQNRPERLQIFAHARAGRADVYILDERGRLLVQRQDCHNVVDLLHHYRRFLDTALARCAGRRGCEHGFDALDTIEVLGNLPELEFKLHEGEPVYATPYLSLQVFADADSQGQAQFTIHANHREFSTWEHGGSLFMQVAEFVLAQRKDGAPYPIYITDLDLSTRFRRHLGIEALRPYDLLNYKKRIELQLTRALTRDVVTPIAMAS